MHICVTRFWTQYMLCILGMSALVFSQKLRDSSYFPAALYII